MTPDRWVKLNGDQVDRLRRQRGLPALAKKVDPETVDDGRDRSGHSTPGTEEREASASGRL